MKTRKSDFSPRPGDGIPPPEDAANWDVSDWANAILARCAVIRNNLPSRSLKKIEGLLQGIETDASIIRQRAEEKGY